MATGCGGGGDGGGSIDAGRTFSYQSSEPQNPLQPGNANEAGGSRIMQTLFKGLVDYTPSDAKIRCR